MLRDGMNINTVARIAKMTVEQVMAIGKKAAVLWAWGYSDIIVWVACLYCHGQMLVQYDKTQNKCCFGIGDLV